MSQAGRCLCGAVSFHIHAAPLSARVCWCRDCQHLAGNGLVNCTVPADALEVTGTLAQYRKLADSGNELTREFCPQCGTHVFAHSSARPHLRVVRVGNLDEPSSVPPLMNIWTNSAPAWACMDDTLQQLSGQP